MNQINTLPDPSMFGQDFNYAVWSAGSRVRLANVPWGIDYRDIVYFPSNSALDTYITSQSGPDYEFTNMTYIKPGRPIRVNMPFHAVYKWNYLRAYNPAQPLSGDTSRAIYYFITDVVYVAPNTTEIHVQVDVWQTFCRDVQFGNCYIERGHIGIANSANFDDNGRTWLTVPEGLDMGNEYIISQRYEHTLIDLQNITDPNDVYGIIVTSTTDLYGDRSGNTGTAFGTVDNPRLTSAKGSLFERLPNGAGIYYFHEPGSYLSWQLWMSEFPWVTQGIISIMVVPRLPDDLLPQWFNPRVSDPANDHTDTSIKMYNLSTVYSIPREEIVLDADFRADITLGSRYANLKKFRTYPYSFVELTTYSGNPLVLKPECINSTGLVVERLTHLAPPSPRIVFYPKGYNAPKGDTNVVGGEFLDMATGIFDFPQFSIVNNGYIQYMAANRNAIAYQHASADWSQQRALKGADTGYRQANAALDAATSSTYARNNAMTRGMALANSVLGQRSLQSAGNAVINGLEQAAGGNVAGGAINAVQGGANAAVDYAIGSNQNFQQNAIQTGLNTQQNDISRGLGGFNADTNRTYAEFAAKGDYANNIAAINARVQDAKLISPTTAGQLGGDAFMLTAYKWGVWARLKVIQPAAMRNIGEYWLRYGYAVNTFSQMPSDFQCMENFTYWKLHETYLTAGSCPETFKQTIRGIFEKGVTVWNNPSKIGQIDIADNDPKAGITL